jgi:hypothetical protein
MTNDLNPLKRIEELKAQIAKLEADALRELKEKREALLAELQTVDAQIAEFTGARLSLKRGSVPIAAPPGRSRFRNSKDLLANAPTRP